MSYNNEYLLEKIIAIQNITLDEKKKGKTQLYIYNNIIRPSFFISYSCYNKYLARNARRELKELKQQQILITEVRKDKRLPLKR